MISLESKTTYLHQEKASDNRLSPIWVFHISYIASSFAKQIYKHTRFEDLHNI